jgi:ABC-type transport system involved in cytochrome bd biosynthesis fused ATPase/permease subunit
VIITHEDYVAAQARRVVRLADGSVVSDVERSPLAAPSAVPAQAGTA